MRKIHKQMIKHRKKLPPINPGEMLKEDFMEPLGLSASKLALDLHVPITRITDIVKGARSITAGTALRLGRYFGTTPQFWLNLQAHYDLDLAEDQLAEEIERYVHPRASASDRT